MTTYNKQTLATFFQTGDVPTGTDYANLIDSQINIVETSAQSMAGPLQTTEIIASRVSGGNVNITGTLTVAGITSAVSLYATNGIITTVSADKVYASAASLPSGLYQGVGIVSAAGTTQGTATIMTNVINRLQGVADGATTGVAIPANRTGWTQYLINETNTSANLWPPTGGTINGNAANTVFALAGRTSYTIFHVGASAYGVK